jgi:hypothetical protein
MALQKREKILGGLTAGLVALWAGVSLLSGVGNPFGGLNANRANLAGDVEKKRTLVEKGQQAEARLKDWRSRSLPSDPHTAQTLYQNWLLELAANSGLRDPRVEPSAKRQYRDVYRSLTFSIHGRGGLDEVTDFLYDFYSAGHLHQIRRLSFRPIDGARQFDLSLLIEALSLASADRADELTDQPSHKLADDDRETYIKAIVDRNVFAAYSPPPPPRPPEPPPAPAPPSFDHTKHTYVTGIVSVSGRPQVWIHIRTEGKRFRLHEGDAFQIGSLDGKVVRIGAREVVLDLGQSRLLAFQGQSLADAQLLEKLDRVALD